MFIPAMFWKLRMKCNDITICLSQKAYKLRCSDLNRGTRFRKPPMAVQGRLSLSITVHDPYLSNYDPGDYSLWWTVVDRCE